MTHSLEMLHRPSDAILNLQRVERFVPDDDEDAPYGNSCTSSAIIGGTGCCNGA